MKLTVLSFSTAFCLSLLLLLPGCGIRPSSVDPPQGKEKDNFPHIYPKNPADPAEAASPAASTGDDTAPDMNPQPQ